MATVAPVHQTDAPAYFFAGGIIKLHLTGAQTGGAFCLLESLMPPDHMTPPHMHRNEDETFLILEGDLDMTVGVQTITLRAGGTALAPRGIPHQLRNTSGRPVRMIVLSTPAGFGDFVMAAGVPARDGVAPPAIDVEHLATIAARFGIQIPA